MNKRIEYPNKTDKTYLKRRIRCLNLHIDAMYEVYEIGGALNLSKMNRLYNKRNRYFNMYKTLCA